MTSWIRSGRPTAPSGSNADPVSDGYTYTYDQSGNRTSQANLTDTALGQIYGYDQLDRLTSAEVGTVSNGETQGSPASQESWALDSLGNMTSNNGTTETFDAANEIQTIVGSTSGYDLAGNMTTTPDPSAPSTALTCIYDAWNRLVQVSSGSTIAGPISV